MPNRLGQFQQALGMQRRTTGCHFHQDVPFYKIRPHRRNLAQMAALVTEVQVALGKNTPVLNEIKLFTSEGVKGMCDPHSADSFRQSGCNSEDIQTAAREAGLNHYFRTLLPGERRYVPIRRVIQAPMKTL